MVTEVTRTSSFAVYDDVLPPAEFQAVWEYMQRTNYTSVHQQMWAKTWRLCDGSPLAGPVLFSNETTARVANQVPQHMVLPPEMVQQCVFPTGRPIDQLFQTILQHGDDWSDLIGRQPQDWCGFTTRAFLYPQGTGLSWHLDLGRYSGAYIYYAHPNWNVKWGGELMIADDPAREKMGAAFDPHDPSHTSIYHPDKTKRFGQHLENTWENKKLLETGTGRYVMPKPNRLVIVSLGCAHCINPVSAAAGDNVRATLTGFFIAPEAARAARASQGVVPAAVAK